MIRWLPNVSGLEVEGLSLITNLVAAFDGELLDGRGDAQEVAIVLAMSWAVGALSRAISPRLDGSALRLPASGPSAAATPVRRGGRVEGWRGGP
jgi:hypothetical protein